MGHVVDDVVPCDALFTEDGDGGAVALREDGHEHVGPAELFLPELVTWVTARPTTRWKPSERVGGVAVVGERGELGVEEALEPLLQGRGVAAGVAEDLRRLVVEEEGVEQVLDGHELVPAALRFTGGKGEGDLDFGADTHGHSGSTESRRGMPCSFA